MAIYHFSAQIISRISDRGTLRSVVAAAAYRSGELLRDEKDMSDKFYKREVAPETYLLHPANAPEWARDREQLWNTVEKFEKSFNAQLAREINIALPRELSEEQQTKLALEFCQKNFVDEGMVADISIHRDKEDNPHFHVMLTLRKIDDNGNFMPKCRRVYDLDKNGNKIPLPSGKDYKTHRENLTNWNDKETLMKWRESWQDITNLYLERNGFSERISCLSYTNQNITLMPTIHEGPNIHQAHLKNQETEVTNYNKQVREYNKTVIELEAYKKEREAREAQRILRCFTRDEKTQLVSAAKQLKLYVNNENLEQRLKQLAKWEKSHFYRAGDFKQFERILKERQTIESAKEILQAEAARFCEKYYCGAVLLPEEQVELVNRTVDKGSLLTAQEVDMLRLDVREREFKEVTKYLLTNGNVFWLDAVQRINREEAKAKEITGISVPADTVLKMDSAKGKYHIYQDKQTAQTFIGCQYERDNVQRISEYMTLKESHAQLLGYIKGTAEIPQLQQSYNVERVERLEQALCVMDKLYDEYIHYKYGDDIKVDNLTTPQKEMLLHYEEYYGTRYQEMFVPAQVYSTKQKEEIINCLIHKDTQKLQTNFPQFKNNNMYLNIFVMDCMSDSKLSERNKENITRYAEGEKIPNGEGFSKAISPHFLIGSLLKGLDDVTRQVANDRDTKMSDRIRNRRRKHKAQELQQNQGII